MYPAGWSPDHQRAGLSSRCCQNGLVSVWTVPQDVSDFPESSFSNSEEWWENDAKPKFMVMYRTSLKSVKKDPDL